MTNTDMFFVGNRFLEVPSHQTLIMVKMLHCKYTIICTDKQPN